jgi:hypothetical protein
MDKLETLENVTTEEAKKSAKHLNLSVAFNAKMQIWMRTKIFTNKSPFNVWNFIQVRQ